MREWLKQLPSQGQEAVDCGSYTLDTPQIAAIEKAVLDVQVYTNRSEVAWFDVGGEAYRNLVEIVPLIHCLSSRPLSETDFYQISKDTQTESETWSTVQGTCAFKCTM